MSRSTRVALIVAGAAIFDDKNVQMGAFEFIQDLPEPRAADEA